MTDAAFFPSARLARKARQTLTRLRLLASLRRLHGPKRFDLAEDDVVVVVVVKNGAYYLDAFLDHYRRLGARHFVFMDNGSTDGTIARLRREPDTIVLQSTLTIGIFEVEFRRHAAETFAKGHWVLFADIDELFDFEGSALLGLSGLTDYMRENGYTALMAQMLEMFPRTSIRETAHIPFETALERYRYFDTTHLERYAYDAYDAISFSYFMRQNTVANERLKFMFGGVRNRFFGELCCLTKHPLVFVGPGVSPNPHPHTAAHVAVADFSAVIQHYKFTDDPFARDIQSLRDGIIPHGADRLRVEAVRDNPDLSFFTDDAVEYTTPEALYASGFLIPSPAFTAFVTRHDG